MSSSPESGLKILIEDARRRQDDTRPDMLRLLAKFYVAGTTHNEEEQARFATLAARLIAAVSVPTAATVVRSLAARADLPRDFILHLARGPLALAGPVLRQSPLLDEAALLDIAKTASPEHLAAIAVRRDVSPALAKKLATMMHGEGESRDETAPPEPLVTEGAPGPAADTPVPVVAEEAGQAEVGNAPDRVPSIEGPNLEPVLADPAAPEEVPAAVAEPSIAKPKEGDTRPAPLRADFFTASPEERTVILARLVTLAPLPLAERVGAPSPDFTDALLDAAKGEQREVVAVLLQEALDVSAENAGRIVADGSGQAFAVAARVLGLSFAVLSRVLFRLHPVTGRSAADMARLAEMFDNLPTASAQHLVASWRNSARRAAARAEDEAPSMRDFGLARPAAPVVVSEKGEKVRQ